MFFYYLCFDNFIFAADFNVSTNLNSMIYFCDLSGLRILINVPICYENFENPTSTDLIFINHPSYFQWPFGLKRSFQNQEPKIFEYHDYKNFDNNEFRSEILKCNFN